MQVISGQQGVFHDSRAEEDLHTEAVRIIARLQQGGEGENGLHIY